MAGVCTEPCTTILAPAPSFSRASLSLSHVFRLQSAHRIRNMPSTNPNHTFPTHHPIGGMSRKSIAGACRSHEAYTPRKTCSHPRLATISNQLTEDYASLKSFSSQAPVRKAFRHSQVPACTVARSPATLEQTTYGTFTPHGWNAEKPATWHQGWGHQPDHEQASCNWHRCPGLPAASSYIAHQHPH